MSHKMIGRYMYLEPVLNAAESSTWKDKLFSLAGRDGDSVRFFDEVVDALIVLEPKPRLVKCRSHHYKALINYSTFGCLILHDGTNAIPRWRPTCLRRL